ncbi:DUF1707 domain-containing protein [Amycolatopsis rubida]|uniref:DUF1707 domain-containing protein n=1 Tax=Amycolatopsis rubida TaxID=112413 RepID=A0ABX0BGB8_9PSEU|nr:DUF1707 domain-containing protein [Amycolatopsis sp. M39]MYW89253.1 DUF1707 domain-containing protein [Amycolatopsis rubida]NEC54231.1 DUF1707 domain-containing protein [Amycolatopsis rubida]OAP22223.1 hypothetical protein A4R44_07033 [Amycolatopsis sp. M39]
MTEVPSPQLRISDQERESALHALGEHMSAGRIDIDEFDERSARITAAKTRGELGELFTDLPVPHPVFGAGATAAPEPAVAPPPMSVPQPAASGEVAARQPDWSAGQRAAAALVPLVWIAAIALIATGAAGWPVIFAPIALTAVGRALWGRGFEHHDHHHRHDRHRERREEFRAMRDEHRRQRRLDR